MIVSVDKLNTIPSDLSKVINVIDNAKKQCMMNRLATSMLLTLRHDNYNYMIIIITDITDYYRYKYYRYWKQDSLYHLFSY